MLLENNNNSSGKLAISKSKNTAGEIIAEILLRGGEVAFRTFGSSMYPLIKNGSTVRVEGCQIHKIRFGDIVLITTGNTESEEYILHRVIKIRQQNGNIEIHTKGDSNSDKDPCFATKKSFFGKLIGITTNNTEFNMRMKIWKHINVIIAGLSAFSALFTGDFFFFKRHNSHKKILPQRLANSALKRLVYLGKRLSRHKIDPVV